MADRSSYGDSVRSLYFTHIIHVITARCYYMLSSCVLPFVRPSVCHKSEFYEDG